MEVEKDVIPDRPGDGQQWSHSDSDGSESGSNTPISETGLDDEDVERQNGIEPQISKTESVWISQTMSRPKEYLFIATICLTQFCNQASFGSMLFLLNTVGAGLGVSEFGKLSWLAAGFSLTAGTFLILSGRLGDAFGYKKVLIIGFAWFSVWSVIAGLAVYSGYTLFVFARALQGVGSAICIPNALAILGSAYPPGHRKAMVFALYGATAPVGAMVGAICAAALSLEWWPWTYWALAIVLAILAVVSYLVIPGRPGKLSGAMSFRRAWDELDILGGVIGIAALVLFNFAWNQAPLAGWQSPQIIVTLILGLVLFFVFLFIEYRYAAYPLLPFDALNADVGFVLAAVACGWATFGIWSLYMVQVLQQIRGLSPLLSAVWMLPLVVTGMIASIITGFLLGPAKFTPPVVMTLSLIAFTVGIILFTTAPTDQIYWGQTFVSVCVIPFGMDMSFPAATLILSNAVKKQHQGIAASLVSTVVNYGISLGVGIAGTVEVHVNNGGKNPEDLLKGFRGALYLGIGLAGLGLLICLVYLVRDHWKGPANSNGEKSGTDSEETLPME